MHPPASPKSPVVQFAKTAFVGLGNATLIGLILLIFADVLMRNLFNLPIPGVMEITEHWLTVPMVFIGIWWAGVTNEHVRVTMMTEKLGPKANLVAEGITSVVSAAILLIMSWYAFGVAYESFQDGEYAGAYELLIWPVRFVTGLGFFTLAIVILQRFYTLLRAGGEMGQSSSDISEAL